VAIRGWNSVPQALTSRLAVVTDHPSDNLAGAATQHRPHPAFVSPSRHKRPHLIDLQYVVGLDGQQALGHAGQLGDVGAQPCHHRLSSNSKQALQPAQTDPLLIGAQHQRALRLRWRGGVEHPIRPTVFTMVLRTAAFIRTISNDVNAAAGPTRLRGSLLNHAVALSSAITYSATTTQI
jgi:hypothetical protein